MTNFPVYLNVAPGSIINTDFGPMIIHKINRKNYVCFDEAGNSWNVPIKGQVAVEDSSFDKAGYKRFLQEDAERRAKNETEVRNSTLTLGSTVKFKHKRDQQEWPGTYVVLSVPSPKGKIRVAKLGGNRGLYVSGHVDIFVEITL